MMTSIIPQHHAEEIAGNEGKTMTFIGWRSYAIYIYNLYLKKDTMSDISKNNESNWKIELKVN